MESQSGCVCCVESECGEERHQWRLGDVADGVWLVGVLGLKSGVESAVSIVQPSIKYPDDSHEPVDSRQEHGSGGLAQRQQCAVIIDGASLSHDEFRTSGAQGPIFRFGSRVRCRRSEASVLGPTVGILRLRGVGSRHRNTSELPHDGFRSASKLTR